MTLLNMQPPDNKRSRLKRVRSDFQAVDDTVIGNYEALTGPQRQTVANALLNWNASPANLAEATTNLNALYALCGMMLAVLAYLLHKDMQS